jgi:hypothetical protein
VARLWPGLRWSMRLGRLASLSNGVIMSS